MTLKSDITAVTCIAAGEYLFSKLTCKLPQMKLKVADAQHNNFFKVIRLILSFQSWCHSFSCNLMMNKMQRISVDFVDMSSINIFTFLTKPIDIRSEKTHEVTECKKATKNQVQDHIFMVLGACGLCLVLDSFFVSIFTWTFLWYQHNLVVWTTTLRTTMCYKKQ